MANPDPESARSSIRRYLHRHNTLSLATCHGDQAWSTDLFYASDDGCQLYFVSSGTTRHCQHIAANPRVSASVSGEFSDWGPIKGLQVDGVAGVVSESERAAVIEMYLAKFPSLQKLYEAPENEQERLIAARLLQSHFYRISPKWVRLIDNSKGFGHKEEVVF
jgi:uncharacterized protein YhbP (UPF0306 family)